MDHLAEHHILRPNGGVLDLEVRHVRGPEAYRLHRKNDSNLTNHHKRRQFILCRQVVKW